MNRVLRSVALLCALALSLGAQNLEIHVINVGWGSSVLVKGPSGVTVLLEAGNTGDGSGKVVPYLQSIGILSSAGLDYTIAGHQHCDHIGGLDEVINAGYDVHVKNYYNGSTYSSSCATDWTAAASTTTAGAPVVMTVGTVIDLGNGAKLTCVACNGSVLGGGSVAVSDENDRSISAVIQYGGFDYLWSSDLGGGSDDNSCTGRSTAQVNVESTVITAISPGGAAPLISDGGIDVLHVNHHGSESSTNSDWFNKSRPSLAIISTGAGQTSGWDLPRIDVVEHVLLAQAPCITAPGTLVLQTEEGSPSGSLTSFAGYCVGDIVVTTNGTSTYTVSADGAVTVGSDERAAAGLPLTLALDDAGGGGGDTTPPVISAILATNVTSSGATVAWTTDEAANSAVEYGTTTSYGSTQSDGALATSHSITLSGLSAGTLYHYRVSSTDASSNTATSADQTFTTGTAGGGSTHVVISEVFYDTPGTDANEEWIELYNPTASTADVSGWTITDNNGTGTVYTIPAGTTLRSASFLTIASNLAGFQALYAKTPDVVGAIPALNNDGDALLLKNGSTIVDAVAWEGGATAGLPAGWGSTTDPNAPTGSSVARTNPATDGDTYADWTVVANNGNPQTQSTVSEYAPASMTVSVGTLGSGTFADLASDDGIYAVLNSTTSGTRTTDWYASVTIAEARASVTALTATYNGRQSRSGVTQKVYLFNYTTGAWNQMDSRTVGTSDVTVTASPATPTDFVSTTGIIRLRVLSTYSNRNFSTRADYVHFSVTASGSGSAPALGGDGPLLPASTATPEGYELGQNYPNPFNPSTVIPFRLRTAEHVQLVVYDLLGHVMANLVDNVLPAGPHAVSFDASHLASGTYLYRLTTPQFSASRRLTLVK